MKWFKPSDVENYEKLLPVGTEVFHIKYFGDHKQHRGVVIYNGDYFDGYRVLIGFREDELGKDAKVYWNLKSKGPEHPGYKHHNMYQYAYWLEQYDTIAIVGKEILSDRNVNCYCGALANPQLYKMNCTNDKCKYFEK